MNDRDFWARLEYRLCDELFAFPEACSLGLWCDGLIPEAHQIVNHYPRITGLAWMGLGPHVQEEWSFELRLPRRMRAFAEIDGSTLIPDAGSTGWLEIDLGRKQLLLRLPVSRRPSA